MKKILTRWTVLLLLVVACNSAETTDVTTDEPETADTVVSEESVEEVTTDSDTMDESESTQVEITLIDPLDGVGYFKRIGGGDGR